MRPASAKNKGRRACKEVAEILHRWAPDLRPGDIEVTSSGACGEDLKLSPAARDVYPIVIESKNQEKLNIWESLDQAKSHKKGQEALPVPVLFFRRNRSVMYVALEAEDFMRLIR